MSVFDPVERSCESCRFWQSTYRDVGHCRRYAPRPTHTDFVLWAETLDKDWCGEWSENVIVKIKAVRGE